MRLLLDEDVPVQLLEPLRHLLPGHQVDHTERLGWKGKKDRFLLPDARRRGYDALLTNDSAQLDSIEECRAIRDSEMHHLRYHQDTRRGTDGLALAMAAVMAAIRQVVRELEDANGQRLVEIRASLAGDTASPTHELIRLLTGPAGQDIPTARAAAERPRSSRRRAALAQPTADTSSTWRAIRTAIAQTTRQA
jgi:hypothetical protein